MRLEIKSRKLGKTVTFSRPGTYYIFVDLNNQPGCLGQQICDNGELLGSTIGYDGEDQDEFARICRGWWKNHLRKYRDEYEPYDGGDDGDYHFITKDDEVRAWYTMAQMFR